MKVALVGAFPPQQKGEGWYLGDYALALRDEIGAASISVISQYETEPFADEWRGFTVDRAIRDRSLGPISFKPQTELVEAVFRHKPDIAHLHYGPNADYGGRLGEPLVGALRRLRAAGIPTVITLSSLWLPANVESAPAAMRLPKFLRPLVVAYFGAFMRRLNGAAARILCLVMNEASPMTKAFAEGYRLTGLDEEVFGCLPRVRPLPAGATPVIVAFGFLRSDKGFEVLLRAFARHVRAGGRGDLIIAGRPQSPSDDAYADGLEQLASATPGGRCTFQRRYVPDDELDLMITASSLVVLPYLKNVGVSGPLNLAIAAGRPIIATSAGHNAALRGVVDLVEPSDEDALLRALQAALDSDDALARRAVTVSTYASRRNWSALAKRNVSIYSQIVGGRVSEPPP